MGEQQPFLYWCNSYKMDITKVDLYGLLEVSPEASTQEIKTAYRRKARKVHPDKNPDDPEASKLFHQLSEALKVLLDETAKAAYDRVLKSKKEAEIRNSKLDANRKKFKDKLEAQEREYKLTGKRGAQASPEEQLKAEIARLMRQGSEELVIEQENIRQELANEKRSFSQISTVSGKLKLSWKTDPEEDEFYSREKLFSILNKYGDISALVISTKKRVAQLLNTAKKMPILT